VSLTEREDRLTRLSAKQWRGLWEAHRTRAREWTAPCRDRLARHEAHPVHDFLTTYYRHSLAKLEEWHPGLGVDLEADAGSAGVFSSKYYVVEDGWHRLDPSILAGKQRERLAWIRELLGLTRDRPGNFACHGVHEWAMVYGGHELRHGASTPLRLPQDEIDAHVRSHGICCSHFDAFRFFAPEARPMNALQPELWTREKHEQPGCLHANMDLYKWSAKAMPWIGSELLWECFQEALTAREIDMRASPYDLSAYGYEAIAVETESGRREYEAEQRAISQRAAPLRARLITALDKVLARTQNSSPANQS
jgi:hypothetical protein